MAYLENESHLTRLAAVHLCLFQHLIELSVGRLPDVKNSPGQCYTRTIKVIRHYSAILKSCLTVGLREMITRSDSSRFG